MTPPTTTHLRRAGLTLVELVVVLAILVALGGLVVINSGRIAGEAQRAATDAVLREVRDAFVGSATGPGYITDCGRAYDHDDDPLTVDLAYEQDMRFLFVQPAAGVPAFDPVSKRGWRGPYLKAAPHDGWGSPIIFQIPTDPDVDTARRNARLVSPGPDRVLATDPNWLRPSDFPDPLPAGYDDVVVFLEASP